MRFRPRWREEWRPWSPSLEQIARSPVTAGTTIVVGIAVLTLLFWRLSLTVPINSDDAAFVLQGQSVLDGNPLLAGWTFPADTFYVTDLPLYVVMVAIRGVSPSVVHGVAAFVYALIVVVSCLLARRNERGTLAWLRMLIPLGLLALPSIPSGAALLLEGPYHTGVTLFLLASLLVLDQWRWHAPALPLLISGLLLALAVASDPLALYVGASSLAAVCFLRLLLASLPDWRRDGALLAVVVSAAAAGTALRRLVSAAGGYQVLPVPAAFTSIPGIPHNIQLGLQGWLQMFGADFFGSPVRLAVALPLFKALGLAFIALVLLLVLWRLFRGRELDRVTQALAAIVVVNVAAYALSNQAVDLRSVRYLTPAMCAGAVLAGRVGVDLLVNRRLRALAVTVGVIYVGLLLVGLRTPPAPQPEAELTGWLGSHGLRYGLSSYWTGTSATVTAHDQVRIRGVVATGDRLRAYHWAADDSWYDPERPGNDARFLVVDPTADGGVTTRAAMTTFGAPVQVDRVGRYTVLVYDHNLLRSLGA